MKENRELSLTSLDEIFNEGEKIVLIPLAELHPFKDHPFQVKDDEKMMQIAESIKEKGVHTPAIVRPLIDGGYEIISGHKRKRASELAGLRTLPVIVRNLSNEEAIITMVDSNLQSEQILPSEKAFAYKLKLTAMKKSAGRPKENLSQVGANKRSDEILGEQVGESRNQIQRYIRLTELIAPLLQMVDDSKIAFNPAVELSYLKKEEQSTLFTIIQECEATPSLDQAKRLKKYSETNKLSSDVIQTVLDEEKPNQKDSIKISTEKIKGYLPKGYTPRETEELILTLLDQWYKRQQRNNQQR